MKRRTLIDLHLVERPPPGCRPSTGWRSAFNAVWRVPGRTCAHFRLNVCGSVVCQRWTPRGSRCWSAAWGSPDGLAGQQRLSAAFEHRFVTVFPGRELIAQDEKGDYGRLIVRRGPVLPSTAWSLDWRARAFRPGQSSGRRRATATSPLAGRGASLLRVTLSHVSAGRGHRQRARRQPLPSKSLPRLGPA